MTTPSATTTSPLLNAVIAGQDTLVRNLLRSHAKQVVPIKDWEGIVLAHRHWPVTALSAYDEWQSYNLATDGKTMCYVGAKGKTWRECHKDAIRTAGNSDKVDSRQESSPTAKYPRLIGCPLCLVPKDLWPLDHSRAVAVLAAPVSSPAATVPQTLPNPTTPPESTGNRINGYSHREQADHLRAQLEECRQRDFRKVQQITNMAAEIQRHEAEIQRQEAEIRRQQAENATLQRNISVLEDYKKMAVQLYDSTVQMHQRELGLANAEATACKRNFNAMAGVMTEERDSLVEEIGLHRLIIDRQRGNMGDVFAASVDGTQSHERPVKKMRRGYANARASSSAGPSCSSTARASSAAGIGSDEDL